MRRSPWLAKIKADRPEYAWAIDITRQENKAWLDELLREFVPWFDGPYFHIGGDEYQHDPDLARCPELVERARRSGFRYPGDVFVDWINAANRTVRSLNKTTMIWSWWRFRDDKTSIQPDRNILIQIWNRPRTDPIINDGYRVILSPEDTLYVSPGLAGNGDGYGQVNPEEVCCRMQLDRRPNVLGYSMAVWADLAEHQSDDWFISQASQPMSLLADRLWGAEPRRALTEAMTRLRHAGTPPGVRLPILHADPDVAATAVPDR